MPKIEDPKVRAVVKNPYFDHHTAMHLSRERVDVFDPDTGRITKDTPILNPSHKCDDCKNMMVAGEDGSGLEFLKMHHDMIRVFRYLLEQDHIGFPIEWQHQKNQGEPSRSAWYRVNGQPGYAPELWSLDNQCQLPNEVRALFNIADPQYLDQVFKGVCRLLAAEPVKDPLAPGGPVDQLGKFIERGVEEGCDPEGRGFHNTLHEYLGSREGRAAAGAEMNKLRRSLFNDYFWSLHLWIDAQYGRLLENLGIDFDTKAMPPDDPMPAMKDAGADPMKTATHARLDDSMAAKVGV